MNYEEYEKNVKKNQENNKKYIDEFKKWLKEKGLSPKTIRNHVSNADFYLNNFLNYYEATPMEEGYEKIDDFLGDWFIRKCMWSTASSTRTTAASIKKFYQCMSELGHIEKENYQELCEVIKDSIDFWIESVEEYNSGDFFAWNLF